RAEDPASLAELLTESPSQDPRSWLVLDDYQHLMASSEAETLVASLVDSHKAFVFIASRRRPSWASARPLVYGELREIPRELLAMTPNEAAEVLKERGFQAQKLIAAADGWPAVIGLAARSGLRSVPTDKLPPQLYDFFAQELYEAATPSVRRDLHRLAILPAVTNRHLRLIFGERADSVVHELIRLGFLTSSIQSSGDGEESASLHPLVRDFLADKIAALPEGPVRAEAKEVTQTLSNASAWDAAFDVI